MEVNKIFNSGDANLIFNNLVNSYYKCLIDLTDVLIGPKNSFETNYNFFASLDFVEKLVVNSEVLQTILGVRDFSKSKTHNFPIDYLLSDRRYSR